MRETWVKNKGVRDGMREEHGMVSEKDRTVKDRKLKMCERERERERESYRHRHIDARTIPRTTHPRRVGASLAHKLIFVELGDAKEAANVTDVDRVRVRHLKEALAQKLGRAVGDHAITLHFAETKATVSRAPLIWKKVENARIRISTGENLPPVVRFVVGGTITNKAMDRAQIYLCRRHTPKKRTSTGCRVKLASGPRARA
jgi:hypothetical protein